MTEVMSRTHYRACEEMISFQNGDSLDIYGKQYIICSSLN